MTAFEWAAAQTPIEPPAEFYCQTSDVWQGRFTKIAPLLVVRKFDPNMAGFLTAVIGEVGDNCFTHNAPGWVDMPGSWLEWELAGDNVRCMIADRGRGILDSLRAVRPQLHTHRDALLVALTERISGRAPEERGNGLKFVMGVLAQLPSGSFSLQSGDAKFSCNLPLDQNQISSYITTVPQTIRGTYCEMRVNLPYAR